MLLEGESGAGESSRLVQQWPSGILLKLAACGVLEVEKDRAQSFVV